MSRVTRKAIQGKTFVCQRTMLVGTTPVNLTGFTGTGTIRDIFGGSSIGTITVTVTDGDAGEYEYSVAAATLAAITAGTYVFDVELSISGETDPVYDGDHGEFIVRPEVST